MCDELIKKQDAINALTGDITVTGRENAEAVRRYTKLVYGRIMRLSPVEPKIIRCKDCRHNYNPPEYGNAICDLFYGMTDQMGYCHYAERR